jgi:hypothetical protein
MRMAHVTRAICKALGLNSDFAEAIALGAKVGAAPFIHVSKNIAGEWLQKKVSDISNREAARNPSLPDIQQVQLQLFPAAGAGLPSWVSNLKSRDVLEQVVKHVPCATGEKVDAPYSSGQESYWLLCTNPYLRETSRSLYSAETMYGIWRHSRGVRPKKESFFHRWSAGSAVHQITWQHSTYESVVVQYADDITWIIENLNDANDAAILGGTKKNLFLQLKNYISADAAFELKQALVDADAGALYTYFISDFVVRAREVLSRSGTDARTGLVEGRDEAMIGPSADAEEILNQMEEYLRARGHLINR